LSIRYPVFLDLKNKKCLVVGGGQVAERKVLSLLECGARVHVVSPEITPRLRSMAGQGRISYRYGRYESSDLEGIFLVIGSTDQDEVNRQVEKDCITRNLVVNIVDDPTKGNFFVPAVVRRGSLTIAVSTGGNSPMLARKLREELEKNFGPQYEEYLNFLGDLRKDVIRHVADPETKNKILESFVDEQVLALVKEGRVDLAKERLISAYRSGRA